MKVWGAVKEVLVKLFPTDANNVPLNMDLLTLNFTQKRKEIEMVWLTSTYVCELWNHMKLMSTPETDQMFVFLKFKYKADGVGSRIPLGLIPDI